VTVHNIAVVGCGGVSGMHFEGYSAHPGRVRVVAACDPVAGRREWAEREHKVPQTFSSIEDLLDYDGWDVAVVCTPSQVRESAVAALADSGKHILAEKPLSGTYEEASRLVALCANAGVALAVNQNFRDHYAFGIAANLIAAGEIGSVLGISHRDLTYRQDRGWRIQTKRHALSVMGVHWLDGFRQLIDGSATRVWAQTYSSPVIDCVGETDAFVQIEFGSIPVSYVQSFSSRVETTETIVFGDKGTLRFDYGTLALITGDGTAEWANPHAGQGKPESTYLSLNRLLDAIEAGEQPSNSGQDNLETIALLEAAYQSAWERRAIELREGLLS
jgi:UDP-N-acetyl-2-amino-2-deoxyglucuronate dehydrogenase